MDLVSSPTCRGKQSSFEIAFCVQERNKGEEPRVWETLKLLKEAAWLPVDRLVKGLVGL